MFHLSNVDSSGIFIYLRKVRYPLMNLGRGGVALAWLNIEGLLG